MEFLPGLILFGLVAVAVFVIVPRFFRQEMTCNRCGGSGDVSEHWPDPSEPSGFHHVEGVCPKCKGRGRLRV